MRILKSILLASALVGGGSAAFAQGRSSESEMGQGLRQSALAFTEQTQDRGFFGIRGVFLPVLTGGFLGDTSARAADDRIATQSITQRPSPYQRPGSVNNREWTDQRAYSEPLAYDRGSAARQRSSMRGERSRSVEQLQDGQPMSANRGISSANGSMRGMR